MKALIIVAHPHMEASKVNKRLVDELTKHPDKYTVHDIYKAYPDGKIDVLKEQKLIDEHDKLILQYPMYWFNCTPLLKQWLDDVFTYGWAYGSKGNHLSNKKIALAISTGIPEDGFTPDNHEVKVTFEQLLLPFKTSFAYSNAQLHSYYAVHNTDGLTPAELDSKAKSYVDFIEKL